MFLILFLHVHQTLLHCQHLTFKEFNHVVEFSFLLIKLSILFLFFSEFASSFQQCLEILFVALVLKEVDFCEELLFFLFELLNLFLKIWGIHRLRTNGFHIQMCRLELSLKVLVDLHRLAHFFVHHVLIRYSDWNKELSCIGFPLQVW